MVTHPECLLRPGPAGPANAPARLPRAYPAVLAVLLLLAGCGRPAFHRGRAYDFLAHLREAEAGRRGVLLAPLRVPRADTFVTGETRLVCPAPAGTFLRFRHVPLGPGARLAFGYGLRPGAEAAALHQEVRLRFQVDFVAGGKTVSLFDRTLAPGALAPGPVLEAEVPIPETGAREGAFLFRTDAAGEGAERLPAWYGPLLRSDGRALSPAEAAAAFYRPVILLLDHPVSRSPAERPGLRVNYDEPAARFLPHPRGRLLLVTPPARARFRITLPGPARLRLGFAPLKGPEGAPVPLRFTCTAGGTPCLEETLAPGSGTRRVHVPLPGGEGTTVEVELAVTPAGDGGGDTRAIWIDPVVEQRCTVPRKRSHTGRNLLLLVVDALRADHTSLYGYGRKTTPHLDRRASHGIVFSRALAESSWTIPSTASLLTGLYAYTHGLYDAYHWFLLPGPAGLPHAFRTAGCAAAAFVSNPLVAEDPNFSDGFETFQAFPYATAAQVNGALLHWLEDHGEERFFAYLHYMEPHLPYAAPDPFYGRFLSAGAPTVPDPARSPGLARGLDAILEPQRGDLLADPRPRLLPEDRARLHELIDLYDGEIAYWDACFERLMRALEKRGLLEHTVVVITADHGEEFLEHGRLRHGQSLFGELLHVPLVILDPDRPPARRDDPVSLVDLAPTLLARLGMPPPPGMAQGSAPRFQGRDLFSAGLRPAPLFAETAHGRAGPGEAMVVEEAVMEEGWKGILLHTAPPRFLLFREGADREERFDASAREAKRASRLRAAIEAWRARSRAHAPYNVSLFGAAAVKRLRELGYGR